jgi:hypothetical protein
VLKNLKMAYPEDKKRIKVFYKISSLSKKTKLVLIWLKFEILSQKKKFAVNEKFL